MSVANTVQPRNVKFEDYWPTIHPTLLKLLRQEPVKNIDWQNLFWIVYEIVMWDDLGAKKLLEALKDDISEFIRQAKMDVMSNEEDQALLKAYIMAWSKFFNQCFYLSKPFAQAEKTLKKYKSDDQGLIVTLMHDSWNADIFSCINNRLLNSAMKLLLAERNGEAFDSQLVIGVRESYVSLCSPSNDKQIYKENFENAYLTATESFYSTKSAEFLALNGVQQYMVWADQKLKEEEQRATKYLESSSFQILSETCVKVLVTSVKETIVAECFSMIKNNETAKLNLMFRLVDRVPYGIHPMLQDLECFIVNQGLADMMACAEVITQDSEKYIEQLLDLFRRFSLLVKQAFNDDPRFLTARDKAFKQVVNDTSVFKLELPTKPKTAATTGNANSVNKIQPESRCPELLANYCDMLLRKTPLSRKLTSDEIEFKLKEVLLVLKYVQNKDVFMRYHKAHLTRRLILDTSADNEKEENMVEWLRELGMPADYVNKLSRMFQDIKVSEDLNNLFKMEKAKSLADDGEMGEQHNSSGSIPESINIKILNGGAWARGAERVPVSLPLDLEEIIPEIEEFYRKKHSGRKLQWHHHMSNGTIAFSNSVGTFDLDVTTFQMVVLFCWNERPHDKISFEDIKLATELPDIELRRTLWSLVCFPKLKRQIILCCSEVRSPKDFDNSSLFYINQEFTIIKNGKPQKRGKLNLIGRLQLSTEKSKEEDNESIIQLRILRTQEAIVKIMKTRQKMSNAQLQTELVEMLKNFFLPSKKMIKEQIEWLIENKFIKRDEEDISTYVYVA